MKTNHIFRQVLPVMLFSTLLLATTNTSAQNHWKKEKREHERSEYRDRYDRAERNQYNNGRGSRDYAYRDNDDRSYRSGYKSSRAHESHYFDHPRYGRVYQRFDYNPVVFHHNRDNYYCYGDHFYTYRRGVGYCMVEPPRDVYFRTLPAECERVYVNGNVFFRHGSLFFQLSPRGYSMVTAPVQLRISAQF